MLHDGVELKALLGSLEQDDEKKKVILLYDLLLHRYTL